MYKNNYFQLNVFYYFYCLCVPECKLFSCSENIRKHAFKAVSHVLLAYTKRNQTLSPQTWAVAFWHAPHNKQKSDGIFPATGPESVNIFPSLVLQYPHFPLFFFLSDLCLPLNKGSKKRVWVYVISPLRYTRYVCWCGFCGVCDRGYAAEV